MDDIRNAKKVVSYKTEKELDCIRWTAKNLDFALSLTITCAFNEMLNAYLVLRDTPSVFKHKVKALANAAERKMMRRKTLIFSTMREKKFFDDYSDPAIDLASKDIALLRKVIEKGIVISCKRFEGDAYLASQIETAYILLSLCTQHFLLIDKRGKELFGIPCCWQFQEFNIEDVRCIWDKVRGAWYDYDIKENMEELMRTITHNFVDGNYIKACLDEAIKSNPEFNNIITLKDE